MCIMLDSRMGSHLQRFARTAAHLAEREGHLFRHQWCATCGAARIIHGEVMESISPSWYDIFHYFHGRCFPKKWWNLIQEISPDAPWSWNMSLHLDHPWGVKQNMVKIWRASRETIWLHIFCGWKDRKLSKDTYFWYHPVMFIRWMWAVQWWGVPVRDFTFQAKMAAETTLLFPAVMLPVTRQKRKLRKDWDANPLTGHNPCTSRRIVTNYETIWNHPTIRS